MKTIVVPVDFSEVSQNAVNYAADLAGLIGTNLALIHVLHIPVTFSEVPATVYNMQELIDNAEEEVNKIRLSVFDKTDGKITVHTKVVEGDIVSEIDRYCASIDTYAVVMGAESANAFERFLFGGKTLTAMKELKWPIIVVPPDTHFKQLRKIGLACDFNNVIDTIPVKEIKRLVKEFEAEFHVVHVNTHSGDLLNPEQVEQSEWLHELIGDLKPKYDFIRGTDMEKSVCEFAEKNGLDLLIVIPKKHNIISDFFQHSHSKRVVLHSHIPIMSIHE